MRDAIGSRQTELALTTGRMFSAQEALDVGLIDKIVPSKEKALADARVFISKFARIPRKCFS